MPALSKRVRGGFLLCNKLKQVYMTQREKYFAAKVAKLMADATAQPEFVKGPMVHTFVAPAMVRPDIQQVACPITGVCKPV